MELRKSVFNKRILISLFVIMIMACSLFVIRNGSSYSRKSIAAFDRNEGVYQAQYKTYIHKIMDADMSYSGISIFENTNSYALKRAKITRKRYNAIKDVELKKSNGIAIDAVLKDQSISLLLMVIMILIVFSYMDYEHVSLRLIISSTEKGRIPLIIKRVGILFLSSILFHFLLYGILIIEACLLFGKIPSFSVSAQSLSYFKDFVFPLSLGGAVVARIIISAVLLWILSLFLWTILVFFSHKSIGLAVFVGIFGMEFFLYQLISPSHPLAIFKYNNLYCYLFSGDLIREYLTYSLFDFVIEGQLLFGVISIILSFILMGVLLLKGYYQRTLSQAFFIDFVEKKIKKGKGYIKKIISNFSIIFQEFYKVVISQKGWLFLLCFVIVFIIMQDTSSYLSQGSLQQRKEIYEKYGGVYNEAFFREYVEPCKKKYHEELQHYDKVLKLYNNKKVSSDELFNAQMRMDNATNEYDFAKNMAYQMNLVKKNKGSWFIDQTGWKMLIGKDGHYSGEGFLTMQKEVMLVVTFLCFFFCNLWDYVNRSGMNLILRSTSKGRNVLYHKRIVMYLIMSILCVFFYEAVDFYVLSKTYPLTYFNAPLSSLFFLKNIPVNVSINMFLIILTIYRILSLCSLCMIINYIFMKIGSFKSGLLCLVICVLPEFLSLVGVTSFHYLSLIQFITIMPMIDQIGFTHTSQLLLLFYLVGYLFYMLGKEAWNKRGMLPWKLRSKN